MAAVEVYQRQEIPQARFTLPGAENGFGELFGDALERFGQATGRAADLIQQKTNAAWLGKVKPQAILDIDQKISDLEGGAREGAPDHVAAVQKTIQDYWANLRESAPDDDAGGELDAFMLSLEAERLGGARRFQKSAEIAQRSLDVERGVSSLGDVVAKKYTDLPWARSELELLIDRQDLPADKGAALKQQSQLKLTDAYLGGLMTDHPDLVETVIESGSLDEYIDPADKPVWLEKAKIRADTLLQTQLALADRADRLAGRELRKRGDAAAKDLWGKFADGNLDRDDIDIARDVLDPGEYRALMTAVAQPSPERDNPQAITAIEDSVGAPDFFATLNGALERGEITTDTYRSYRMIDRKLEAESASITPYATTYGYIKDGLASGAFLFGGNSEAARQARSKALQEFDLWARENPGATIAQFDEIGRKMVDRYRAFTWDSLTATTGLPAFYSGTRDGLTGPEIDKAEAAALQALDRGTYSRQQLVFELKKLNDWREILKRKAAQ
jgi:hypothetical protein